MSASMSDPRSPDRHFGGMPQCVVEWDAELSQQSETRSQIRVLQLEPAASLDHLVGEVADVLHQSIAELVPVVTDEDATHGLKVTRNHTG